MEDRYVWHVFFINTVKRNTEALLDALKEAALEVITKNTKYMLMSHRQNAEQNWNIKVGDRFFENVAKFKYSGMIWKN
jgi:hypothetical protein